MYLRDDVIDHLLIKYSDFTILGKTEKMRHDFPNLKITSTSFPIVKISFLVSSFFNESERVNNIMVHK